MAAAAGLGSAALLSGTRRDWSCATTKRWWWKCGGGGSSSSRIFVRNGRQGSSIAAVGLRKRSQSELAHCKRGAGRSRALQEDETSGGSAEETQTAPPPSPSLVDRRTENKANVEKGRTTAIVTGVISVLLGVGYLVLLQLLDTRGVNLIPPPPEAFDP